MSFIPTVRAYRFTAGAKRYAIDIQNDGVVYGLGVHLFVETGEGWHRVHAEMEPFLPAEDQHIAAAGGPVKFCELIISKVNRALRLLQGDTGDLPPGTTPQEQCLDWLNGNVVAFTGMDGVVQLRVK